MIVSIGNIGIYTGDAANTRIYIGGLAYDGINITIKDKQLYKKVVIFKDSVGNWCSA